MEINPSNIIDHSREIVWSGSDGPDGQGSRSYTCTFCKRGFSNAQALGGHMNIHRKDRARLKESFDETPVSSDSTKKTLLSCSGEDNLVQQEESSREEEKTSSLKRLWRFPDDDDDDCASPRKKDSMGEAVQLPLFVETPSTSNSIDGPRNIGENHKAANDHTSSSSTTAEILDLELRLGMNSQEKSRNKLN